MKKCVIIGGGFSGLTTAVYLSKAGFKVEILEASPKLGGRAYSLKDKNTGSIIDNGQHILMGCYRDALNFLNIIGAAKNIVVQKQLRIIFLRENFTTLPLESLSSYYPFNLLSALFRYKALSLKDRLRLLLFMVKLTFYSKKKLSKLTVCQWLEKEGQTKKIRNAFWEILAVGALNTNIKKASANIFANILKEIFFKGNKAAAIILPKVGLSETYCEDAARYISKSGGVVNLSERVKELVISDEKILHIKTSKRIISDFDCVISSVPLHALIKILPRNKFFYIPELEYSSILTVHLWLKENNLAESFYGLIDSPVHWIFNHKSYITLVISDAEELIYKSKTEIFDFVMHELGKYVFIKKDVVTSYKVIKEKHATFIPSNKITKNRPGAKTGLLNFYLAGDWTNTGLPSTIESACRSGRIASEYVIIDAKNSSA